MLPRVPPRTRILDLSIPMLLWRRLQPELSMVVLICTLSMLFFAAPVGPYSTVHGPVTAMRALQASLALFWSILAVVLNAFMVSLRLVTLAFPPELKPIALPSWHSKPVLRC